MTDSLPKLPLHLIPSPGASDEFMAIIQPYIATNQNNNDDDNDGTRNKIINVWNTMYSQLRSSISNNDDDTSTIKLILEGYTRDGWSWKPNVEQWITITVINVHENQHKKKLFNFIKYLKERQKSAYGRFGTNGVFVVSYVQSSSSSNSNDNMDHMDCRITTDCSTIPNCTLVPLVQLHHHNNNNHDRLLSSEPAHSTVNTISTEKQTLYKTKDADNQQSTTSTTVVRKKGGLLGKLVGAQQRTNEHVVASKQQSTSSGKKKNIIIQQQQHSKSTEPNDINSIWTTDSTITSSSTTTMTTMVHKSAQEVIADFRQECHDKMLNFDISDDEILQIPIVLKDYMKYVIDDDDKTRISMDVLKYIVYEAAEEVNEEWVAYKEPSEFMDDIMIIIYKEGAVPQHVLEDINQAEIPDEIRGQQRAIQEQRNKSILQAEMKQTKQIQQQQINYYSNENDDNDDDDDLEALNTKKRDRRTIEDYEREKKLRKSGTI